MLKLLKLALFASVLAACSGDEAGEPQTSEPDIYGTGKFAWTVYAGFDVTDDVPVTIDWGGDSFMPMRYWVSIVTPEAGTGYAITGDCLDPNGVTEYGDGGIGDGSSATALQGEFLFYKDISNDCHFNIDMLFGMTSPVFDWRLEVGSPN